MIAITEAVTQNKITHYVIHYNDIEIRKRYSEFDTFHGYLKSEYPDIIIPAIPNKTSLKQYAAHPNTAKIDPNVIDQRKRLLERFLKRVIAHPILAIDATVLCFLDPSATPQFNYKKRQSIAPKVKHTDPKFIEYNATNYKKHQHYKLLERLQRKSFRKFKDMTPDDAELGAVYNAMALTEQDTRLHDLLQSLGYAVDQCQLAKIHLTRDMLIQCEEPLLEYRDMTGEIQEILDHRIAIQTDFESTAEQLQKTFNNLKQLEREEEEYERLEEAYKHVDMPKQKGVIGQLSNKFNTILDKNPEETRKHNIAKLKDTIAQVPSIDVAWDRSF